MNNFLSIYQATWQIHIVSSLKYCKNNEQNCYEKCQTCNSDVKEKVSICYFYIYTTETCIFRK